MCFLTNEDDNYWGISAKEDDNIRKEVGRKEGRSDKRCCPENVGKRNGNRTNNEFYRIDKRSDNYDNSRAPITFTTFLYSLKSFIIIL
jgi:hypothetical protein